MAFKRLFWDIETSCNVVYTWRIGRKISLMPHNIIKERAIICISYKWGHEDEVHTLTWNAGCDKALIAAFHKIGNEADEMIAHNGDNFDLKWYNGRCVFHDLPGASHWRTVDTLKIARRQFKLNSNRLDYLGHFLFGEGKQAHSGFDMWRDIMEKNCPKAMGEMVGYCEQDVRLLEKVFHRLEPFHTPRSHQGVLSGLSKWTCPFTGSENVKKSKTRCTTRGTIQHQMYSHEAGAYYTISNRAYEQYRKDRWEKAHPVPMAADSEEAPAPSDQT
jgi:hypothetical protein